MNKYLLLQDYHGIPANTELYGPYAVTGGNFGYFQQKDIPASGESGTECLFASFVESNPAIFKELTQ